MEILDAYQYKRLSCSGIMCHILASSLVTTVEGVPGWVLLRNTFVLPSTDLYTF